MKIAISAQEKDLNGLLDPRFGRAQFFIIYDMESKEHEVIDNLSKAASGGAGSSSAKTIADSGAEVIISGNFGPNASMALNSFGIKMCTSKVDSIINIIKAFENDELPTVTQATTEGKH